MTRALFVLLLVNSLLALLALLRFLRRPLSVDAKAGFVYVDRQDLLPRAFFESGPELQIAGLFAHLLPSPPDGGRLLTVLDIGMNTGFFSLLAASRGAEVFSFEPQPRCVRLMQASLVAENAHLRSRLCVTNVAVGPPGVLEVPDSTCYGGFRGNDTETSYMPVHNRLRILRVPLHSLAPPHARIHLVKIDTEGAEAAILKQLLPFVRKQAVDNLVVEVVPSWWASRESSLPEGLVVLRELERMASSVVLLDDARPFPFSKKPATLPNGISGPAFTNFSMTALIEDRFATRTGCNLWFSFQSSKTSHSTSKEMHYRAA